MNITYESVEVSTPFFHENNTAAMNTYEAPVQSEASLVQSEASLVQSEAGQSEASPVQSEAGVQSEAPVQSGEENTFAYVLQTSISQIIRMKEYHEVCACGASCINTYGSIMCKAILNKATEEYEKLVKCKEIVTQHIRPMAPWETENTDPVPWRWENRTAVSSQERGKCLLYLPMTYEHAFEKHPFDPIMFDPHVFNQHVIEQHMSRQTPLCFLHENDVVDNGTVMCLRAFGNECFYGNETMKAILEFDRLYRPENTGMFSSTTWLILIVLFFIVGALTRKAN
jgi:hypothetical protein